MLIHTTQAARKYSVRLVLVPLLLLLLPLSASAYQHAGHYYSVHFSYLDLLKDAPNSTAGPHFHAQDIAVVSFCAQLPDQSSDLDAVSVYFHAMFHSKYAWLRWALENHTDSNAILKMVLVQQLLHGLTGGDARAVRSAASATVSRLAMNLSAGRPDAVDRNAGLCALGFAMHLYGDSYAHTQMVPPGAVETNSPPKMYPTGRGHAWDMHYPDYPLCAAFAGAPRVLHHCQLGVDGRFGAWKSYLESVYETIYRGASVPDKYSTAVYNVVSEVYSHRTGAWDLNDWNEGKIQDDLYAPDSVTSLEKFFRAHRSSEPCATVLAAAEASGKEGGPLRGLQPFSCQEAWSEFAKIGKEEFAAAGRKARPVNINPDPLMATATTTPFTPDN